MVRPTYSLGGYLAILGALTAQLAMATPADDQFLANAPPPPQAAHEPVAEGPVTPSEEATPIHTQTATGHSTEAPVARSHRVEAPSSGLEPSPTAEGDMTGEADTEPPQLAPIPEESQPLIKLYESQKTQGASPFLTPAYAIKVGGVLLVLLTLAFAVLKLMAKSQGQSEDPLVPFRSTQAPQEPSDAGEAKSQSWLQTLLKPPATKAVQRVTPKIIARTKLGPTKEIHVLAVGQKRLVVGSTAQQMTLLTSWDEGLSENVVEAPVAPQTSGVHRKYLEPPTDAQGTWVNETTLPEVEEVVVLEDYEDQYPGV